ncbi:MAG: hypothetical protein WD767_14370 [Alphaproteobacteria bacterium]
MTIYSEEERRRLHLPGIASKIERDAEVREFIEKNLPVMTFAALGDACRERFGPERSPSSSAIHRYWKTTPEYRRARGLDDDAN